MSDPLEEERKSIASWIRATSGVWTDGIESLLNDLFHIRLGSVALVCQAAINEAHERKKGASNADG